MCLAPGAGRGACDRRSALTGSLVGAWGETMRTDGGRAGAAAGGTAGVLARGSGEAGEPAGARPVSAVPMFCLAGAGAGLDAGGGSDVLAKGSGVAEEAAGS
jgi:hypothetical protein